MSLALEIVENRSLPFRPLRAPFPALEATPAAHLRAVRAAAPEIREQLKASGAVELFATRSLVTLPYPRQYGLWEACTKRAPFVFMTNRMAVVRFVDFEGRPRVLVAEPSDYELGAGTPFLDESMKDVPLPRALAMRTFFRRHGTVEAHLLKMGIRVDEVDWLFFDHLHTQDLRRLLGTTTPQPELGYPDRPIPPLFPRATLLTARGEMEQVDDVHPFQRRFHQAWTYRDLDRSRVATFDGSLLLGHGVALLRTPGHTFGNTTLVVNTKDRGLLTSSENGISTDSYAPEHSKIPGVAAFAFRWDYEVVLNYNVPEFASWQYDAMVLEKLVADPVPDAPQFPQCVPSSELTRSRLAPGIAPTWEHGELTLSARS